MSCHLAQANIARMRANPNTLEMSGLVARLDEINKLAEQSRGFVWRLKGSEASVEALRVFEDYSAPFEPERLFYNMSVWETFADLRQFTFRTGHAEMLRDKHRWIEPFDRAHLALWWIPAGHLPTIAESADRLSSVHEKGPTSYAFTLAESFPPPAA